MDRTPVCFLDLQTMPFEELLERLTRSLNELRALTYAEAFACKPEEEDGNPGRIMSDICAIIHRMEKDRRQPHFTEEQWEYLQDVFNAVHLDEKWLFKDYTQSDPEVLRIQNARWDRIQLAVENCLKRFAKGFPEVIVSEESLAVEAFLKAQAEEIARDKERMAFKLPPTIATVNTVSITKTSITVGVPHPRPTPPPRPKPTPAPTPEPQPGDETT